MRDETPSRPGAPGLELANQLEATADRKRYTADPEEQREWRLRILHLREEALGRETERLIPTLIALAKYCSPPEEVKP